MKLPKKSKHFITSLDRSVLGVFANDETTLILLDALYRNAAMHGGVPTIPMYSPYYAIQNELVSRIALDDIWRFDAELLYWWQKNIVMNMLEYYPKHYRGDTPDEVTEHLRELHIVSESPVEMQPYFVAGLWDVPFIQKCLNEDIEPALALSILSTTSQYAIQGS